MATGKGDHPAIRHIIDASRILLIIAGIIVLVAGSALHWRRQAIEDGCHAFEADMRKIEEMQLRRYPPAADQFTVERYLRDRSADLRSWLPGIIAIRFYFLGGCILAVWLLGLLRSRIAQTAPVPPA